MVVIPPKLKTGDEIRVVSPARSLAIISPETREIAIENLKKLGFKVSFSKYAEECDYFLSSSIASRVADIHAAFLDPQVKGILGSI